MAAGVPGPAWTDLLSDPAEAASVWKLPRGTGRFSGILKLRSPGPTVRSFWGQISLQYNEVSEPLRVVLALLPDSGTDDRTCVFERTRNEILAGVSHELFTPLNAVIGFSEMLLEPSTGPLSATQADYLRHILDNGFAFRSCSRSCSPLRTKRDEIPVPPKSRSYHRRQRGKHEALYPYARNGGVRGDRSGECRGGDSPRRDEAAGSDSDGYRTAGNGWSRGNPAAETEFPDAPYSRRRRHRALASQRPRTGACRWLFRLSGQAVAHEGFSGLRRRQYAADGAIHRPFDPRLTVSAGYVCAPPGGVVS